MADAAILALLIFAAALLYSSVGHAGASGYLAAMALFGLAPGAMKPTALALNILVASIATVKYYRARCFSWSLLWPFAIASIPFAFLGGSLTLPSSVYKQVVGAILLFSAYYLFRHAQTSAPKTKSIPVFLGILCGAGIGLLSGLTGIGGGIFLSPLLLFLGWAETRQTSGVAAAFILVNSAAALLGHWSSVRNLPDSIVLLAVAAAAGGMIGSELGSRWLASQVLRRLLGIVLVIAGLKLMLV